jgi:hypothetical protein
LYCCCCRKSIDFVQATTSRLVCWFIIHADNFHNSFSFFLWVLLFIFISIAIMDGLLLLEGLCSHNNRRESQYNNNNNFSCMNFSSGR